MSSSRAARWAAQRASWKLANRGDTHFAAEKRLYGKQLRELRKEWMVEDLMARRAAYVQRREAMQQAKEAQASKGSRLNRSTAAGAVAREHEAETRKERAQKIEENNKRENLQRVARRQEAEAEFRLQWLQGMLDNYDIEGVSSVTALSQRKRAWLTAENFDKRLQLALIRSESPMDKWNGIARALAQDEAKANLEERSGGLVSPRLEAPAGAALPHSLAPGSIASSDDGAPVAAAPPPRPGEDRSEEPLSDSAANDEALLEAFRKAVANLDSDAKK